MQAQGIHFSINTSKLKETITFYTSFLGTEPVKQYDDYAKFQLEQPALNLAINAKATAKRYDDGLLNHVGLEFDSPERIVAMTKALEARGIAFEREEEVTCCYGVQEKLWVRDPNGIAWECYAIIVPDTGARPAEDAACCATSANADNMVDPGELHLTGG